MSLVGRASTILFYAQRVSMASILALATQIQPGVRKAGSHCTVYIIGGMAHTRSSGYIFAKSGWSGFPRSTGQAYYICSFISSVAHARNSSRSTHVLVRDGVNIQVEMCRRTPPGISGFTARQGVPRCITRSRDRTASSGRILESSSRMRPSASTLAPVGYYLAGVYKYM